MLTSSWNPFRKQDPKELVRKWKSTIRSEIRRTEREINSLLMEQKKATTMIKDAAKRNDMTSAKLIAKEVVRLRKAVARLAANKATMLALSNEMTQTLAISSAAGTIKSSTGVMTKMNDLLRVPQLQKTMKDMAKEMARTGYMQEMMNDAVDSAVDTEDIEEAADEAVDQVLLEITGETLNQMANVPATKVQQQQQQASRVQEEEEEDALMAQLAGLKAS